MSESDTSNAIRLQKFLAEAGVAPSRREAERMIAAGEVTINGRIAQLGDKVIAKDHIKVRGKLLHMAPQKVVLAFFKPRELLLPKIVSGPDSKVLPIKEKVFTIGSLDKDSEGMVLLTNDGDLSSRLTLSKFEVPQVYHVKIDGHLEDKKIKRLSFGVPVEGQKSKPVRVVPKRFSEGKQWLEVTITETRNRHIRKIFEAVGHPVDKVRRESFAGVDLRGLRRGEYRYLAPVEVNRLREWVGLLTKKGPST